MKKKSLLGAVLSATVIAGTLGTVAAYADPSGSPTYRQLSGVGSDTTEGVMNGLANAITSSGVKVIGSYDANGSATITTKDPAVKPGCSNFTRPNGSGAGQTELGKSMNPADARYQCVDFARSSSGIGSSTPSGTTFVPFATDAVSFAVTNTSAIPRKLTLTQLQGIYQCLPAYASIKPLLPQSGSGTRKFWLKTIFGSETPDLTPYPCIKDVVGGNIVQEHDGRVLDDNSIVPISAAQNISQAAGTIADVRGASVLGQIDNKLPSALNTDFGVKRDVYNVIPTANLSDPTIASVFVGSTSSVCSNLAVIQAYGFGANANCGSVSLAKP